PPPQQLQHVQQVRPAQQTRRTLSELAQQWRFLQPAVLLLQQEFRMIVDPSIDSALFQFAQNIFTSSTLVGIFFLPLVALVDIQVFIMLNAYIFLNMVYALVSSFVMIRNKMIHIIYIPLLGISLGLGWLCITIFTDLNAVALKYATLTILLEAIYVLVAVITELVWSRMMRAQRGQPVNQPAEA
ncbi:hypothetical protein PFISCL1PPCAC_22231, partial [Pristionchus fissidentatus]